VDVRGVGAMCAATRHTHLVRSSSYATPPPDRSTSCHRLPDTSTHPYHTIRRCALHGILASQRADVAADAVRTASNSIFTCVAAILIRCGGGSADDNGGDDGAGTMAWTKTCAYFDGYPPSASCAYRLVHTTPRSARGRLHCPRRGSPAALAPQRKLSLARTPPAPPARYALLRSLLLTLRSTRPVAPQPARQLAHDPKLHTLPTRFYARYSSRPVQLAHSPLSQVASLPTTRSCTPCQPGDAENAHVYQCRARCRVADPRCADIDPPKILEATCRPGEPFPYPPLSLHTCVPLRSHTHSSPAHTHPSLLALLFSFSCTYVLIATLRRCYSSPHFAGFNHNHRISQGTPRARHTEHLPRE
jgi:hypothetical protein